MRVRGAPLQVIGAHRRRSASRLASWRPFEALLESRASSALAPREFALKAAPGPEGCRRTSDERFLGVRTGQRLQVAEPWRLTCCRCPLRAVNKTRKEAAAPSRRQPFHYSGAELPVASMTA